MANDYSTLSDKRATEKNLLVRISPRRIITDVLVLDSGTTYVMTPSFGKVAGLVFNNVRYTKVASSPASGQFSFDETTGELSVNFGTALLGTDIVTAEFYLYFTNYKFRYTYEDPIDSGTPVREWDPRIVGDVSFSFNIENILAGIFSFSNSSLTLKNQDYELNQYFTDNDSWNGAEIKFYHVLDDVENVQFIYAGSIREVTIDRVVSLNFDDDFTKLSEFFYSNGTFAKSVVTTSTHTIKVEDQLTKIRKIYGRRSRTNSNSVFTPLAQSYQLGVPLRYKAVNVNYNGTIALTNNEKYLTCVAHAVNPQLDATITSLNGDPSISINQSISEYSRYDQLARVSDGLPVTVYSKDTGSSISVNNYPSLAVSDVLRRSSIVDVVIQRSDGTVDQLRREQYTIATNADGIYEITLTAAAGSYGGAIDPEGDSVYYTVVNHSTDLRGHAEILKDVLERAGLTTNAASFTAAESALSMELLFSVPYADKNEFPSYRDVVQKILYSTRGYIILNNSNEVEYHLTDTLSSSQTISSREVIKNTFGFEIDYKDIVTSVSTNNNHGYIDWYLDGTPIDSYQSSEETSLKAEQLHGIKKSQTYEVLSKEVQTSAERILEITKERRMIYFYETKGKHFESLLGDDETLSLNGLPGTSSTIDVKILGITKSKDKTRIKASDLLGI